MAFLNPEVSYPELGLFPLNEEEDEDEDEEEEEIYLPR
jgi:hypothetical protein